MDLDYLGGIEAYADAVGTDEAEVVVAISAGLDAQVEDWQRNLDVIRERYDLDIRLQTVPQTFDAEPTPRPQGFDADVYHLTGPGELPAIAEPSARCSTCGRSSTKRPWSTTTAG